MEWWAGDSIQVPESNPRPPHNARGRSGLFVRVALITGRKPLSQQTQKVGTITHIIAAANDVSAIAVIEAIQAGQGSESCRRQFEGWRQHKHCQTSKGTIDGKPVTLVIGEYRSDVKSFLLKGSFWAKKKQLKLSPTTAELNRNVDRIRPESIADQVSASVFLHGHVGLAPDPVARAVRNAKKKARARVNQAIRRGDVVGHSWC